MESCQLCFCMLIFVIGAAVPCANQPGAGSCSEELDEVVKCKVVRMGDMA